jgi:hypothetical protein
VAEPADAPPPLVIDMDEPLLLAEPAQQAEALAVSDGTDNATCFVCHGNHRMKVRTVICDKRNGRLLRTNRED